MLNISISNEKTTGNALSVSPEIGELVQTFSRDQKNLEERLLKDSTRTKSAKQLAAAEAAQKKLKLAAEKTARIQVGLNQSIDRYNQIVNKKMQILGTTDYLILSGYAQALQDKKPSDVMKLDDIDAYRSALLHPVLKLNSSIQNQSDAIEDAAEKLILGDEAYQDRQQLKDKLQHAEKLEAGLLQTHADYASVANGVKQNMVNDNELEPVIG